HRSEGRNDVGELILEALVLELGGGLGVLDLQVVEVDLLAGELFERAAQTVRLRTPTTDHDAGTGGVDVDVDTVPGARDLHAGDPSALHARGQELADLDVLGDVVLVLLVGEPLGPVVRGDAETEAVRLDLLSHFAGTSLATTAPTARAGLGPAGGTA